MPKNRLQKFCSVKCQVYYNNRYNPWAKKRSMLRKQAMRNARKQIRMLSFEDPRCIGRNHHLGTRSYSTDLKIIEVDGQERIRAAVWLENSLHYFTQKPVEACLT